MTVDASVHAKKLFFFLNHPAHYHLFKHGINHFIEAGYRVKVGIVRKDVLEDLVKAEKWDYVNLFPEGRRSDWLPVLVTAVMNLIKAEIRLFAWNRQDKPHLLIGTEGTLAHTGTMLKIPSILFNEDDTKATPENLVFYPFAKRLVLPECCDPGKWVSKRVSYKGYHELAYLHPDVFTPDPDIARRVLGEDGPYFILRLASLTASHDAGVSGIDNAIARRVIELLKPHGRVFITAERPLRSEFEPYRLKIDPKDIFHVLAEAELCIGDSQTMAAESAVLGTPSIRFNGFVGRLGYLEELERTYHLTRGVPSGQHEELYRVIEEFLAMPCRKETWRNRRTVMFDECADVRQVMIQAISEMLPE